MKRKWAISVFLSICLSSSGQDILNQAQIMDRYWNYRYNLVGDRIDPRYPAWPPGMMFVGDCQGCSLPGTAQFPDQGTGTIWWSENLYRLGRYLEVLATEWKLLSNTYGTDPSTNGGNLVQTETELYYAIKAAERLDYAAQSAYGVNANPTDNPSFTDVYPYPSTTLQGYIARDDVPWNFLTNTSLTGNPSINAFGGKYTTVNGYWDLPSPQGLPKVFKQKRQPVTSDPAGTQKENKKQDALIDELLKKIKMN